MPKHKPKRSHPTIDMTAMCDVAFLLLTFFMLTAKAKPQETVVIDTPASVSETKLPDAGTLTISVDKDGKVYLDMAGQHTRKNLIASMNSQFQLGLNEEEQMKFAIGSSFGVPRAQLKQWINLDPTQRAQVKVEGVPSDTTNNELGPWVHNARLEQAKLKMQGVVTDEYVIVVKADQNTPYPAIQKVINTLTDINVNKFNLITSMEGKPGETAAADAAPAGQSQ